MLYAFLVVCRHGMNSVGDKSTNIVIAKCSEPQAVDSDVMDEGSGVTIVLSVRTET